MAGFNRPIPLMTLNASPAPALPLVSEPSRTAPSTVAAATLTAPLAKDWIAAHIPHAGSMCLLDAVAAWDDVSIRCTATSHLDAHNPLRADGRLAAICGVEYAAQAMAVHGAALASADPHANPPPRAGFLASLRDLEVNVARLDTLGGPLEIEAERLGGDSNNVLYRFTLHCGGELLMTGRAAVILDADAGEPAHRP
ncbi:3-hydroxylacyl-ACP dehydratase [Paraburkholderia kururiensis]|uniref:hydroxymyristoyl-ACP dehydratase n=1 Tax=Paraburkholderia kururiensis TaxID=984307 RepID=UPI0039A5C9DF